MPLRDHFRSPVDDKHAWNELHAGWPMMIVQHLYRLLPEGFVAAPGVHLATDAEIDIGVLEDEVRLNSGPDAGVGGTATAVAPSPTLTVETDLSDQDEFEVRVYDTRHGRTLVAAIELVSPRNKDRPDSRRAFVGKVAALLQKDVCVSIVDLVSTRHFNFTAELLRFIERGGTHFGPVAPHLYAATLYGRKREGKRRSRLDLWHHPMAFGEPLPTLPIWLEPDRQILLPLDIAYEETCKLMHIR